MATQQELAVQLTAVKDKLSKVQGEFAAATQVLLDKVAALQAALDAASNVTPELQAAADAVSAQAQVLDDLNPDAAPPTA